MFFMLKNILTDAITIAVSRESQEAIQNSQVEPQQNDEIREIENQDQVQDEPIQEQPEPIDNTNNNDMPSECINEQINENLDQKSVEDIDSKHQANIEEQKKADDLQQQENTEQEIQEVKKS